MKLRNKKTGEIAEASIRNFELVVRYDDGRVEKYPLLFDYSNFEDYEEPKEYWCISQWGDIVQRRKLIPIHGEDMEAKHKEIGNYFDTREEAEKALEKLKAIKRLKDKGFRFGGWKRDERFYGDYTIEAQDYTTCSDKDLDTLFGGEE